MTDLLRDWSPYRWGLLAAQDQNIEFAFQQVQADLQSIGVQNVAFLLDVPLNDFMFPGQDHVVGTMVHPEFPALCEGTQAVALVQNTTRLGGAGCMRPENMGDLPDVQTLMYDVGFSVGGFCTAVDDTRKCVSFLAARETLINCQRMA